MKRLISIIIALCLLVSAMPILAQEVAADNILYYDNFLIEKNDESYVMVGILDPIDTDKIIVPQELHGWVYDKNNKKEYLSHESYTIAAEAFKNCTGIHKIEFEKGVELIPYGLCSGMIYLEEVILPESVKTIENEAFRGCESLKTIDLSKVENLGRSAFEGCISLESVTLSENIEAIDAYTFYGCERLEKVIGLHEGIAVGQDAFRGTKVAPYNEVEYFYLAQSLFKNQDDIVEINVDALSRFPKDNDPESEKYDFKTNDKETIKAVLGMLNMCRYTKMKGTLASDGTTFRINVTYSDGTELSQDFKESTTIIDNVKYQMVSEDYLRLAAYLKYIKAENEKNETFVDVHYESEYYEAIKALDSLGIMSGYADGTFGLEEALTRAEAAAILVRLLKLDDEVKIGETMFADVDKSHWASGYINIAVAEGIINGQGDGTFAPDELVTCNQIVKMLVCALGYEEMAIYNGGWANDGYLFVAEKIGLIEKENQKINTHITRGEAALLCYKALYIELMDQSCDGGKQYGEFYQLVGKTILTEYWNIEE